MKSPSGLHGALHPPQSLFPLICVRAPYFALEDVRATEAGLLTCTVVPQHPLGSEVGLLAGAEAGRHLAIAGS